MLGTDTRDLGPKSTLPSKTREESMLGTDMRDLVPMSIFPNNMWEEGMMAELMEVQKLHERQLRRL